MKRMKYTIKAIATVWLATLCACTNLDETVYSEIVSLNYYNTGEQVLAAYLSVYTPLQDVWEENYFNVVEFSTDEACRPTKVAHGYDGGQWIRFHRHQWETTESRINDIWNKCFKGIGFANSVLRDFQSLDFEKLNVPLPRKQMEAEMRSMRAFYYFMLCDLFGGVPIVETVAASAPKRNTRAEVVRYIEDELKAVLPDLPVKGDAGAYGKLTQGGAWGILARLYLNHQEWTGTERWDDCIRACDEIINSGKYELDAHWQDPFHYENEGSKENIFVVPYDDLYATQLNYPGRCLHYAHKIKYNRATDSSNGIGTEASFLNKYKPNDKRIDQWLVGPQYAADGVTPLPCVMEMAGQNLVLDPVIISMEKGAENSGARNVKFVIKMNTLVDAENNDVPIIRYADILLMKAECFLRTGKKPDALPWINRMRARCFEPNDPDREYTDITMDEFLDERAREFSYECLRRQDLIRFGKYNEAWWDKPATDPTRKLYPIPDARIKANPNMIQNPGY
jgi:hypothetical protein